MTARIGILISGRGSNMEALVQAIAAGEVPGEVGMVIANNPSAGGLAIAEALDVPTDVVPSQHRSRAAFEDDLQARLEKAAVDFVCLAGFMRVLTDDFVRLWEGRMLNIHPSLLPLFRGLHVHEQVLAAQVAVSGCTVHYVTPELDSGPIVGQAVVPVMHDDTPETLAARVQQAEHALYPAALARCLGASPKLPRLEGMLLSLR